MQRLALALLFLASCGKPDDPIVNALPHMPAVAASEAFDARSFVTLDHLRAAGFPADTAIELRSASATAGNWALVPAKGPAGQLQVEVRATADDATRLAASMAQGRTRRGDVLLDTRQPDFVFGEQESFVPEGTWIRTLDFVRARGRMMLFLRLEETGTDADGRAVLGAMEKRAQALIDQIAR